MVNLSFGLPFGDKKKVANTAVNSILQLETRIRLDPSLFTQLQPRGRRNSTSWIMGSHDRTCKYLKNHKHIYIFTNTFTFFDVRNNMLSAAIKKADCQTDGVIWKLHFQLTYLELWLLTALMLNPYLVIIKILVRKVMLHYWPGDLRTDLPWTLTNCLQLSASIKSIRLISILNNSSNRSRSRYQINLQFNIDLNLSRSKWLYQFDLDQYRNSMAISSIYVDVLRLINMLTLTCDSTPDKSWCNVVETYL